MPLTTETSFYAGILEFLPDAVLWAKPIYAGSEIIDFEIAFCNAKADLAVGHPLGSLMGLTVRQNGVPSLEKAAANFESFKSVYQSGVPEEYAYYAPYTNQFIETTRRRYNDGVLSVIRDRKKLRDVENQVKRTDRILKSIVDTSPNGILVYEVVRDANHEVQDFQVKHYNERSNELTGFSDEERANMRLREALALLNAGHLFQRYKSVVENGVSFERELFIERSGKWVIVSVGKLDDGILILLTDITELKHLQQALQHQSVVKNSILDASLNGIYSIAAIRNEAEEVVDFTYVFANSVVANMLRTTTSEIVGRNMLELIPENRTNGFFDLFCQVLKTGLPIKNETEFVTATLNHWFEYVVVKMDENTLVVTLQDVTEQKRAAIHIKEQKQMLDNILEHSSCGISVGEMIRDKDGRAIDTITILANDAAAKNTGIPLDIILTKTASQLDAGIMSSPFYQQVANTLKTGIPFQSQYYFEGTGRWLETSVSKMNDDTIITIFTDVTEAKQAQFQLEKYVEELKRSNANLEEFSYAASHDLKEPIRKIITFTNQLKGAVESKFDDGEKRIFERIQNAAGRMGILVDDLLEYSHVTVNPEAFETIDLNQKVEKVLENLELIIQEKSARINVGPLPIVKGIRRQIEQVLQNLLSNSLKYVQPGKIPVIDIFSTTVYGKDISPAIAAELHNTQYYRVDIVDNGIGFEAKYAEKIFQVFQRLHGKAEYQGTGVGLAIVKKVIQNHQGFITAESQPGEGARFSVFLPVDYDDLLN